MHHRYLPYRLLVGVIIITLFFSSCTKKQDSSVGPDVKTGTTLTPRGSISDTVRIAAFDTLTTFLNNLPHSSPDADNQLVLSYLNTRPEFESAGLSPDGGNVWARFVDGSLFLVLNNRTVDSTAPGILKGELEQSPDHFHKSYDVLPGAPTARIMNSLGAAFPFSAQTVARVRSWCQQVGYTLSTPDVPSVENLMHISGDGIFYWTAHGGTGMDRNLVPNPIFAMWTSDAVNASNIPKYNALVDSGYLVYASAPNDVVAGKVVNAVHYMVTMKFIGKYMSFAPNSLVYFDACGSGGFDKKYLPMLSTAGFYLGWSLPTDDAESATTAQYFFDRTLGINAVRQKADRPQRPFFTGDILSDMAKKKLDVSGSSRLVHPAEPVLTTLRLLAPSISLTSGDASISSTKYTILGDFGADQGTVLLNGSPLTAQWSQTSLTVTRPTSGGTLQISVRNVKSNPVNLTEWHGTLDYTFTGKGTLKQHIVFNLDFFADVHSYHVNYLMPSIYSPFFNIGRVVQWLKTSSATYDCSGEYRDSFNEVVETWTGGASLPLVDIGTSGDGLAAYGMVDSSGTNSTFLLNVSGKYSKWTKSGGTQQVNLDFPFAQITLTHTMPDFVFQSGQMTSGNATMTWGNFITKYAPDPNAPQ